MSDTTVDYLVIGAGPAGLQVAHSLGDRGHDYVVLESGAAPGTSFSVFPRHRQLISVNKRQTGTDDPEFNLKMDWNSLLSDDPDLLFTRYSDRYFPQADDFTRYLGDFAAKLGLRIEYDTRVTRVTRSGESFAVTTQRGDTYRARRVVVSTGVVPNAPGIPGIEEAEHYATFDTDPAGFAGQRVLIVGKGNSAFETADSLLESAALIHVAGPHPINLSWHSHYLGHLRAVNNNFLDTYQLKLQNAVLDVPVTSISRTDSGYEVGFRFGGGPRTLAYDRVIMCTGFRFDASIFDGTCAPELAVDDRFPAVTGAYESVSVPDLYFAGTLSQQLDFKHGTSAFIHGFRYGARVLGRVLEERYHGAPWPGRELPADPGEITRRILDRVNHSSALWQQFGTLADVVVVPESGPARHYEEMPVRHVAERGFQPTDRVFTATLEYGPRTRAPFDGTTERADARPVSPYFHPVIRHVTADGAAREIHLPSDLENAWRHPVRHVEALREFLSGSLAVGASL